MLVGGRTRTRNLKGKIKKIGPMRFQEIFRILFKYFLSINYYSVGPKNSESRNCKMDKQEQYRLGLVQNILAISEFWDS